MVVQRAWVSFASTQVQAFGGTNNNNDPFAKEIAYKGWSRSEHIAPYLGGPSRRKSNHLKRKCKILK